jgi:hypothetical protein
MIARIAAVVAMVCGGASAQPQLTDLRTGTICDPAIAIDLGTVGTSGTTAAFRITNIGAAALTLEKPKISGVGFDVTDGPTTTTTLLSQETVNFKIKLTPTSVGAYSGKLYVNTNTYLVVAKAGAGGGDSTDPTVKFAIATNPATLASGQQARLSLNFDAPAAADGNGLLKLDFIGKADPAIQFIAAQSRSVPFTVTKGESTARFAGDTGIDFQAGTTAGSIIFTATLGDETEQATLQIAPAVVGIDSIRISTDSGTLLVATTGFDNTRTTSLVTFRFLDKSGLTITGGSVTADVSPVFATYFAHPEAGGQFVLRAAFPIVGDSTQLRSVEVELVNAAGSSKASVTMTE